MRDSLPTSSAQGAIYRDMRRFGGSHQISFLVRLKGDVSIEASAAALRRLLGAHSLLTSTFHETNGELRRLPGGFLKMGFDVVDCSGKSDDEFRALAAEESVKPFDLTRESGVRFRWYVLDRECCALQGVLHHMIYDHQTAVGLIASIMSMLVRETSAPLNLDHSVFVEREIEFLASDRSTRVKDKVGSVLRNRVLGLPTPPGQQGIQRSNARVLNCADIVRGDMGNTIFHLVLCAWWVTLGEWLGRDDFSLGTTMSLRVDRELRRVFGPVFQYVPIVIDITRNMSKADTLQQTVAAVNNARRGSWLPLHHLPGGENLPLGLNANINFYNFDRLGARHPCNLIRRPEGWTSNGVTITEEQIPQTVLVRPYDLNLAVTQAGGRIALSLRRRPDLLSEVDAIKLLSRLTDRLTK